jgi:hypothetical protein
MHESQLIQLSSLAIHKRNLLEGWVVICSYNFPTQALPSNFMEWIRGNLSVPVSTLEAKELPAAD